METQANQDKQGAYWVPDEQAEECSNCHKNFTWRLRRHHCRLCGNVFCGNCSSERDFKDEEAVNKKVRMCAKCFELRMEFDKRLEQNQLLLAEHYSEDRLKEEQNFFETKRRESVRQESKHVKGTGTESDFNMDTLTSDFPFVNDLEKQQNFISNRITTSKNREKAIQDISSLMAAQSDRRHSQYQKYLKEEHFKEGEELQKQKSNNFDPRIDKIIENNFETHIQQVVRTVMSEFGLEPAQWFKTMYEITRKTITTVKPRSVLLKDPIDIKPLVKIVKIEAESYSKSRFVNGIVFKKYIANKHMRSNIENPKILLLANSLGYVQEDDQPLFNIKLDIGQEEQLVLMIKQKIDLAKPDVIFIEKDAAKQVLDMLFKQNKTVVTNTPLKMMHMIARSTQTIICPSFNLLSREFKLGSCGLFKVEYFNNPNGGAQRYRTSLLCLEGCRSELGCTIQLAGPDLEQLRKVRHAFHKCIELARSLYHESEYLKFIKPDLDLGPPEQSIAFDNPEPFFKENSPSARFSLNDEEEQNEFKQIEAPFLFDKMMQRQSLIFESFTLAFPQKNLKDEEDDFLDDNQELSQQRIPKESLTDLNQFNPRRLLQGSTQNNKQFSAEGQQANEAEIRRQLKRMCNKPVRTKVDFYHSPSDMSVYTMVKTMAYKSIKNCTDTSCGKPMLAHTHYYYHGPGAVEIKLKLDEQFERQQTSIIQKKLDEVTEISIYIRCMPCEFTFINKTKTPQEVLEMSFFKLLEQFFYNADFKTLHRQRKDKNCQHSFHSNYIILFKYGPVKMSIRFERLQEYTLDLIHFGTTPGVVKPIETHNKIKQLLLKIRTHLDKVFGFIQERFQTYREWFAQAIEELPGLLTSQQDELKNQLIQLLDYILNLQEIFLNFMKNVNQSFLFTLQPDDLLKYSIERVQSILQANRLGKLVAARISEYLFLLLRVKQFLVDYICQNYFAKKQTLLQLLMQPRERNPDESFVSLGHQSIQLNESKQSDSFTQGQRSPILRTRQNTLKSRDPQSKEVEIDEEQQPILERFVTSVGTVTQLTTLKDNFRTHIYDYEKYLSENEDIGELLQFCAYLPNGFNNSFVKFSAQNFDFISMIAYTLNSNHYITGLQQSDYMEMSEKIEKKDNLLRSDSGAHVLNDQSTKTYVFQKDQDVLNQHVPFALAQQELGKPCDQEMTIHFSSLNEAFLDSGDPNLPQQEDCLIIESSQNLKFFVDKDYLASDYELYSKGLDDQVYRQLVEIIQPPLMHSSTKLNVEDNIRTMLTEANPEQAQIEVYHLLHKQFEFSIRVYYPTHFEALRKIYCGNHEDFIKSLSESFQWADNSGGKTKSTFYMSHDKKYVLKQVKSNEVKMFDEMSQQYFDYMRESFARQCPTTIAKTLGIFKIKIKTGGMRKSEQFYLILMENLLLKTDEQNCVMYDLKGSRRNRYINKTKNSQVTLDNNFLQDLNSRPIPLQYSMKRMLNIAIQNDALFLNKLQVVDYSMFVIINHEKCTIRLGIIDYIQKYNLEKTIESNVKVALYGEQPTIISPEAYQNRFRISMDKYFIAMIPDKEANVKRLVERLFNADSINWCTKETEKAVK